jgi:hypothetical protein
MPTTKGTSMSERSVSILGTAREATENPKLTSAIFLKHVGWVEIEHVEGGGEPGLYLATPSGSTDDSIYFDVDDVVASRVGWRREATVGFSD